METKYQVRAKLTHDNDDLDAALKHFDEARMEFHYASRNLDDELAKAGVMFELVPQVKAASGN